MSVIRLTQPSVSIDFPTTCLFLLNVTQENILWVFYEDMIENLEREVRKVAKFVGVDASESLIQDVVTAATFKSMKQQVASVWCASTRVELYPWTVCISARLTFSLT